MDEQQNPQPPPLPGISPEPVSPPTRRRGASRGSTVAVGLVLVLGGLALLARAQRGSEPDRRSGKSGKSDKSAESTQLEWAYELDPGGALSLSVDGGDVVLSPGTGRAVRVVVRLREGLTKLPDDWTWREVRVDRTKLELTLGDEREKGFLGKIHVDVGRSELPVEEVRIELPSDVQVDVATGMGDVNVTGTTAAVAIRTGAGDVDASGLGGRLSVSTGAGDVDAKAGGDVEVDTGAGDVEIVGAMGRLRVKTGAGDVTLSGRPTGVDVSSGVGDVELSLDALGGDVVVHTGMGEIELRAAPGVGFVLQGRSGMGSVELHAGEVTRESAELGGSLDVTIGAGGPHVTLRSGAGSIEVSTAEPAVTAL